MGNKLSNHMTEFTGDMADTPEQAARSLEKMLRSVYPNAFVTVGSEDLHTIMSPRGTVSRIAFAKIGDGRDYKVVFRKDGKLVRASVSC